jgi:hypothetical protein
MGVVIAFSGDYYILQVYAESALSLHIIRCSLGFASIQL